MDGERGLVDYGADAGFFAEMGEVGGEAVADVDHGVNEGAETAADGDTRLRVEMGMFVASLGELAKGPWAARKGEELGGGSAKRAGDVEEIAGAGCGAEARGVGRELADGNDVG